MRLSGFFLLIVISIISCRTRQKTMAYEEPNPYHPEKPLVKYRLINRKDSLHVLLSVFNPRLPKELSPEEVQQRYKFEINISSHQGRKEVEYINITAASRSLLYKIDRTLYLSMALPATSLQGDNKIVIGIDDQTLDKPVFAGLTIDFQQTVLDKDLILFNHTLQHPVVDNYVSLEDTFILDAKDALSPRLAVYYIEEETQPATKPYSSSSTKGKRTGRSDSCYYIFRNTPVHFAKKGLYLIKRDSLAKEGITLLIKDSRYPQITKSEELIEPLYYLLTDNELALLKKLPNLKMAVDSFWLSLGGSKDYSRHLIKSYYEKVEYCNKAFTSYKEGWKTDRGMIYIVFGKPDLVLRTEDEEEWIYENILTHMVSFSFVKKETLFLSQDYELIRRPYYEKYWNSAIEKWRSGIIMK